MASTEVSDPQIGVHALAYYIKRICSFLENDKKTLSFPRINRELEDILVRVVSENPMFLDSDKFSSGVREEARKLASVMRDHSDVQLKYEKTNGKHGPNVLTFSKQENLRSLRPPCGSQPSSKLAQPDKAVTPGFKLQCLTAATNFVKDDNQLVMKFPDVTEEQVEFIRNMILPGKEGNPETDVGYGYRSMYAPLWEAMKVFSLKYAYNIQTSIKKNQLKQLVFQKVPKKKKQENILTESLNNSVSSASTTSTTNKTSAKAKKKKTKPKKKVVDKMILKLDERIRNGIVPKKFVQDSLQKISEFLMDDSREVLVISDINEPQMQFVDWVKKLSVCQPAYMIFPYKCQTYLDDIKYCVNVRCVNYRIKRVNGANETLKNMVFEKVSNLKSPASDMDISDTRSVCSSISSVSAKSLATRKITRKPTLKPASQKMNGEILKTLKSITDKMQSGALTQEFIECTLKRILIFVNDEQEASVLFGEIDRAQQYFVNRVRRLALEEASYTAFSITCQNILGNIRKSLEINDVVYNLNRRGAKDFRLEKVPQFSSKKIFIEKNNNENVNNMNQVMGTSVTLTQDEQTRLIQLKTLKDSVIRTSGELAITDYLKDISIFLNHTNMDMTLTFDDVTQDEALFLKHVHVLSKMQAAYEMFSRDCQKLLTDIRNNAQAYKIKCQIIINVETRGYRTVVIEKQKMSSTTNKCIDLYHRARSLSAGRRAATKAMSEVCQAARTSSTQRGNIVKDKLKAGLAQPVHPDNALKMMEMMGWKGGSLGIRGDGITEPISISLDRQKRAGLGHVVVPKKPKESKKPKEPTKPKEPPKSKEPPKPKEPTKPKPTSQSQPRSSSPLLTSSTPLLPSSLMPQGVRPVGSLPDKLLPPGIISTAMLPPNTKAVYISAGKGKYHGVILKSILEIITSDVEFMYFVHTTSYKMPKKIVGFIKHAAITLSIRSRGLVMNIDEDVALLTAIYNILEENRGIMLHAEVVGTREKMLLKKSYLIPVDRKTKATDDVLSRNENGHSIINEEAAKAIKLVTEQVKTIDYEDIIEKYEKTTKLSRQWYNPLKSTLNLNEDSTKTIKTNISNQFPKQKKIAPTKVKNDLIRTNVLKTQANDTEKTTEANISTQVLELKTVALSKVKDAVITTNVKKSQKVEVTKSPTLKKANQLPKCGLKTNIEDTVVNKDKHARVRTLVKSVKTPNMTRKQLAILNAEATQDQKTNRLRIDKLKIDKTNRTDVVAQKVAQERAEPKERRARNIQQAPIVIQQGTNSTEITKTAGEILLEKLMFNINDPKQNRNYHVKVKKLKSPVADRLRNAVSHSETNGDLTNEDCVVVEPTTANVNNVDCFELDDSLSTIVINSEDEALLLCSDDDNEPSNEVDTEIVKVEPNEVVNDVNSREESWNAEDKGKVQLQPDVVEKLGELNLKEDSGYNIDKVKLEPGVVASEVNKKAISWDNNCEPTIILSDIKKEPPQIQERKRRSADIDSDFPNHAPKKFKLLPEYKKICIQPKDFPHTKIDSENVRQIQTTILKSIDYTTETLPLLKCQGIQNGSLIYSCQDEKSFMFLENLVKTMDDYKLDCKFDFDENVHYKMALKIGYLDEPAREVLYRLEMYNPGMNATTWNVIKKEKCGDYNVIHVEVDQQSFNIVCCANFQLYAGYDCVEFSILWD